MILNILYLLFIAPIEFLMRLSLELFGSWTHSWGWALVLLSLLVNMAILPIYNWVERQQEEERRLRGIAARHEAMIRRTFHGQKRFALLSVLRRQLGYGYSFTLRASMGLLLQIPFFLSAYHLLSHFSPLTGLAFGCLRNLAEPDALLSFGDVTLNILPLLMTVVNLASAFVYTSRLTYRDKVQIYGMALFFLVLLYSAPAALTLYWTLNNVFSLAKNIIEKDWMRRPAWRKFWSQYQYGMTQNLAGFPMLLHFLKTMSFSLGVGIIFCIYVCTLVLLRNQNILTDKLYNDMLLFAEQYFFTALLAGFVLFCLTPSRSFLLIVATSSLFILHPSFFEWILETSDTRLLAFNLWNINGYLFFSLWVLIIFVIQKYGNKTKGIGKYFFHIFCRYLEHQANKRRQQKFYNPIVVSSRNTIFLSGIMGICCGSFFCYFIPFSTFLYNIEEFDFSGFALFKVMLPYFIIISLICTTLFYITTFFVPCKYTKLFFGYNINKGAKINICHIITLIILIIFWFEGSILSYSLPLLNGRNNLFDSIERMIFDSSIIILLFSILLKFKKILYKNFLFIIFIITIFSLTTLTSNYIEGNNRKDVNKEIGVFGLRLVNRETLFSQFRFSDNFNIIILIVDSLDSLSFEKTLETYPELRSIFDGFWFFKENLGVGSARTNHAIPQILSGNIYEGNSKLFRIFSGDSILGYESMLADARQEDMIVFADIDYSCIIGDDNFNKSLQVNKKDLLNKTNLSRMCFKFLPYIFKHLLQDTVNINTTPGNISKCNNKYCMNNTDVNKEKFNNMINSFDSFDSKPIFSMIHFLGVHVPLIKGDMISTIHEYVYDLKKFIYFLKSINVYNQSIIIIMADHGPGYGKDYRKFYPERHGTYSTVYFPFLLIKMPDSEGDMIERNDLMSSSYVRELIQNAYVNGATNESMTNYLKTLPKTRKIYDGYGMYYPKIGTFEAEGTFSTLKIGGK